MFAMIDTVAEMATSKNWHEALNLYVYEFLSIYSYSVAKHKYQERQVNDMYSRIKHH